MRKNLSVILSGRDLNLKMKRRIITISKALFLFSCACIDSCEYNQRVTSLFLLKLPHLYISGGN